MTAHGWQEDERGLLADAGSVGGDAQVGPAYSRRFWAAGTELFELVEVYGYAARDREDAPVVVQLQWGYSICSDRNDPGMTEQWADYLHEDVGLPEQAEARAGYANAVEHATGYAREVLTRLTAEDFAAKAEEICSRVATTRPGRVAGPESSRGESARPSVVEQTVAGYSSTLKAQYPCCGKPCRLKVFEYDEESRRHEIVIRDHWCDPADETGTRWRIERKLIAHGGSTGYRADKITFLDLGTTEAEKMYGRRFVPHRTR